MRIGPILFCFLAVVPSVASAAWEIESRLRALWGGGPPPPEFGSTVLELNGVVELTDDFGFALNQIESSGMSSASLRSQGVSMELSCVAPSTCTTIGQAGGPGGRVAIEDRLTFSVPPGAATQTSFFGVRGSVSSSGLGITVRNGFATARATVDGNSAGPNLNDQSGSYDTGTITPFGPVSDGQTIDVRVEVYAGDIVGGELINRAFSCVCSPNGSSGSLSVSSAVYFDLPPGVTFTSESGAFGMPAPPSPVPVVSPVGLGLLVAVGSALGASAIRNRIR